MNSWSIQTTICYWLLWLFYLKKILKNVIISWSFPITQYGKTPCNSCYNSLFIISIFNYFFSIYFNYWKKFKYFVTIWIELIFIVSYTRQQSKGNLWNFQSFILLTFSIIISWFAYLLCHHLNNISLKFVLNTCSIVQKLVSIKSNDNWINENAFHLNQHSSQWLAWLISMASKH